MKIKNIFLDIILIICTGIIIIFCTKLGKRYFEDQKLNKTYDELKKNHKGHKINWKKLMKQNPDIVGWVYVKGTEIDYPVVKGKTNQEYLHKTFKGNYSYGGCIFIDSKCDIETSQNIIVYGHHMRNGSMFADLINFRNNKFAKKHKIYFYTPNKTYQLKTFSCYAKRAIYDLPISFSDSKSLKKYYKLIYNRSDIYTRKLSSKKQMFTFVTCSYEGYNYRTYVHASEY